MAGIRILLVEDEELIRLLMAEVLADEGFEVTDAATADEAATLLDGPDGFDLLLTDVQMPGTLDGVALARRFRDRHPGGPVVYVTGRPESLGPAGHLGERDAFVRKPYGPGEIIAVLRRLLGGRAS